MSGLLTSQSPVIASGAHLLGFSPQAVRHLWEADRLRLGETDTDEMDFSAMSLREAIEEGRTITGSIPAYQ